MDNMNANTNEMVTVDFNAPAPVAPAPGCDGACKYNKKHDVIVVASTAAGTVVVTLGVQWLFNKIMKKRAAKKEAAQPVAAAVNPVEDEE